MPTTTNPFLNIELSPDVSAGIASPKGWGVTPQPFGSRLARPAPLSAEDQPVRDQVAPHGYDPYPPPLELHDLDEGTRTVLWNYIRVPRECHAVMRTQIVQMYDQSSSGSRLSC